MNQPAGAGVTAPTVHSVTRSFIWLVAWAGFFSAATALVVVVSTRALVVGKNLRPEIALPLLLIVGLISLVIALGTLVAAFKLFDLTDRSKPFGVPEGTLQAVIALALILIFAITSLYLRGSLDAQQATLNGLTPAQAASIPIDQILSQTDAAGGKVNVVRLVPVDQDAKNFSNQLLTILGTLVGAVAGFYFGAKSVETGVTAGGSSVAPTNTAPPAVTGNPRVGESVQAELGGWTGSPPPSYGHQWQRKPVDRDEWLAISGANSPSYLIPAEDAGAALRVAITATNAAGATTATSRETDPITRSPAQITKPTITGSLRVDEQLEAQPGQWEGFPTPSFSYAWQRSSLDQSTWSPIETAQAATYVPTRDDVGRCIRLDVTASNPAGPSAPVSSDPTQPVAGDPLNVAPPTIEGTAVVGATLSANPGQWSGYPLPYAFQWERSTDADDADWQAVEGAKEATYQPAREDVGKRLRVVTAVGAVAARSAASDQVKGAPEFLNPPAIDGNPIVGKKLHARPGDVSASPPAAFTYQWQQQSETGEWTAIAGAQSDSYVVQTSDLGRPLRVAITAVNEVGPAAKESPASAPATDASSQ